MRRNKDLIVVLYIVLALPIIPSLVSIPFSLISLPFSAIGLLAAWRDEAEFIRLLAFIITMLLAGLYPATYIFALYITWKEKEITSISLLPFLHILVFFGFCSIVSWIEMKLP